MVQLPPDPLTKVPPEAVLASRMPLALVVSKLPLLVKVLVALMMRFPPARTNEPSLVTELWSRQWRCRRLCSPSE